MKYVDAMPAKLVPDGVWRGFEGRHQYSLYVSRDKDDPWKSYVKAITYVVKNPQYDQGKVGQWKAVIESTDKCYVDTLEEAMAWCEAMIMTGAV